MEEEEKEEEKEEGEGRRRKRNRTNCLTCATQRKNEFKQPQKLCASQMLLPLRETPSRESHFGCENTSYSLI